MTLTQTIFNDFLFQTYRCGQTRHHKSLADSANGATVVNGPAAHSLINDAYHGLSTEDLLHFSHCPSFDSATDKPLMTCGIAVAYYTWHHMALHEEIQMHFKFEHGKYFTLLFYLYTFIFLKSAEKKNKFKKNDNIQQPFCLH